MLTRLPSPPSRRSTGAAYAFVLALSATAAAQVANIPYDVLPHDLDSGYLANPEAAETVAYRGEVSVPGRKWLRLEFESTNLPAGSRLRLTSLQDGAVQWFDARSLRDYAYGSAYFNGDAVRVELLAAPDSRGNRVHVTRVTAASGPPTATESICGSEDDRLLSDDPRQGRQWPTGCTAWLIDATTVLTAGHCVSALPQQIHFNVPLSSPAGAIVLPPPDQQFPYDMSTLQRRADGQGADWAVVSTVRNSNTGLYPGQSTHAWYELGTVPTGVAAQQIRITGYGSTSTGVPASWYAAQKTHLGPLDSIGATALHYRTDTTGGNSGSPVLDEDTGRAIGIHTHGGCFGSSGSNTGTRIDLAELQSAIEQVRSLKTAGSVQRIGTGCRGTSGTPQLSSRGFPDVGRSMTLQVDDTLPHGVGAVWFGASRTMWAGVSLPWSLDVLGATGCTLYCSIEVVMPMSADVDGHAEVRFPIPVRSELIGQSFYNQHLSLDPDANPAGVSLTNAAASVVGS